MPEFPTIEREQVNAEFKYFDDDLQFTNIPSITPAGVGSCILMALNDIPQGTGVSAREGAVVRIKSMQHSCTIDNTLTGSIPCRVRMIFFLHLRPVVAITGSSAPSSLLDLGSIDPINAFRNLDQRSEYVIIRDRTYRLDVTAPQQFVEMSMFKRFNFHTQWTGNDTTGVNFRKNALYCMVFCDNLTGVPPRIRCTTRIRYIDN